ncbi:DUF1549 and DUF1553 domain-containing protein [Singulisphaera sp. Ch08]|uniref:DUF1549 and DUF1553 domain-containing protein n=1 Tax=Singulisphaera sp. Ch08 TaxID=3120278 RepID=A0AAU7C6V2_9BACT
MRQSTMAGVAVGLALMPALLAGFAGPTSAIGPPDDPPPATARSLVVEPKEVTLHGRWDTGQLLISATDRDGVVHDLTESAAIEVEDPDVVAVGPRGELTPRANGRTSLIARVGGEERRIPLTVELFDPTEPVSFRRHIIPALTVAGCNAGACHGTPAGRNGFRLSLRGFDPVADYASLARDSSGRRISPNDPDSSLVLLKGLGRVPHGGALRLLPDGAPATLIRAWIAGGAPDDPPALPALKGLEVRPGPRILQAPERRQQVSVTARFADGASRDVTRLTWFTSSDESIARVEPSGVVEFARTGEVAILCRYLDRLESAKLTFVDPSTTRPWPDPVASNFVDKALFAKQKLLGIAPAGLATDHEFLRRAYLDLCGILPAPAEARAFLDDSRPEKRARLIDALLERPEYAEFWALKWADVLGNNRRNVQPKGTYLFQQWLRDHVARNTPLDTVFRELIAAEGSTFVNPPTNYFRNDRVSKEPELLAQNTTQLFLGVRMSCARCHNHPFEAWTQDDYYGFTAFFARVDSRVDPLNPRIARFNQGALVIADAGSGETIHPRTGAAVPPKFLGGPVPEIPAGGNRRTVLAGWLTASDNPYFARQLANRVWYHLLGRGIVDPVDDVRDSNPPASEELLQALADDLVRHRFDLKHLIRTIANSRTYQLSADAEGDADAEKYFARAIIRLHGAEPLLDAISAATDVPEPFKGMPEGTRAVQLPDGDVYQHPFLSTFGQPARETACECERGGGNDAGLIHALELINGTSVKSKLSGPKNRIGRLLEAGRTDAEVLEELYLATLSRRPTESEARSGLLYVASTVDRRLAWEDVQWALLSTKEFLYRH